MITSKFHTSIPIEVFPYIDQFNVALRVGYNRLREGMSLAQASGYIKTNIKSTVPLLDVTLLQMAVNKAKSLVWREDPVIFGGKKNLYRRSRNLIDKQEWHDLRNASILLRGNSNKYYKGNSKAHLDIINNQVLFRPKRGLEIPIKLPHLSNKTKQDLFLLQTKCELGEACFSLEIGRKSICIIYDEKIVSSNYKQITPITNRILAIDLNPNYIGLVVKDNSKIIHKEIIDASLLKKTATTNKRKHWILETSKYIANLCAHYRCNLAIEKLSLKSKDNGIDRAYNKAVNNTWNRNLLINNLKKRVNLLGVKCLEIRCAYSSFVGQMLNQQDYDSVAAAIEIANRALLVLAGNKNYKVLPSSLDLSLLSNQWKEVIANNGINNWLQFYEFIKKSKISYRILFTRNNYSGISYNFKSYTSSVLRHVISCGTTLKCDV